MAHLEIAQDWLHIRLGMYEKVLTVHGSLTVNLTHIRKVDPHPKAPEAVDLVNFSGTYVPGRVVAGTETTRGDRLFITLLGSAFINLAWLGLIGGPQWWALVVCLAYAAAVFRYV